MKKIIIAFDCDGTLIKDDNMIPNKRIVELLKILSSFKNIKIIVWSGRGKVWATNVGTTLNLTKYIDGYASKNHLGKDENGKHMFAPEFVPDIVIDDIQNCTLGIMNLIVKEK